MLARYLQAFRLRYTYRFLFIPGTIGSLTWLARNEDRVRQIAHGLVLSCLGDAGGITYKQSRRANAPIDRIVAHVLRYDEVPHRITSFVPYGYDERQYCSPGFDLPVGCLMRTPHGEYPSTIARPTMPRFCAPRVCHIRSPSCGESSQSSRAIPSTAAAIRRANRSSVGAACMRRWAGSAPRAATSWLCSGY